MANKKSSEEPSNFLRQIVHIGINGGRGLSSARELGDKYINNPAYGTKIEQINALAKWEGRKNFTSGFLTSLGGILTLPVSIPASLGANWILQTRMVAAMAYIGGFDIDDPPVRMSIALCLLGRKGKDVLNQDFEKVKEEINKSRMISIPKRTLLIINQTIASRLMKIAAKKGFSRISKAIPLFGGVFGGIIDYQSCKETSDFAKELFQFHLNVDAVNQDF
ncbi:EcsC family protein [bacterium]|nr:EcsC family protein [bacterium]